MAGQCQFEATAQRQTVHGAGHRLVHGLERAVHHAGFLTEIIGFAARERRVTIDHHLQIRSSHKGWFA